MTNHPGNQLPVRVLADQDVCPGLARHCAEHGLVPEGVKVAHDSRVFWITSSAGRGTVNVAPSDGSGKPRAIVSMQRQLSALATDGVRIFWVNATAPDGAVFACVIDDCEHTIVAVASEQLSPFSVAIDAKSVFWANIGVPPVADGTLNRVAIPALK